MKRMNLHILMSLALGMISLSLEGASDHLSSSKSGHTASKTTAAHTHEEDEDDDEYEDEEDDEYDILHRDEIDDTDTFAIPFDSSEVEDEEQINRDEKKDVFHLPHSR